MDQGGIRDETRGLPVAIEPRGERPSLVRADVDASFLSQLLAARGRLAQQRHRRQAPVDTALNAYETGAERAVKRLPQGWRTSREA